MRQISLGPFITCFLASIVLKGYLRLILNKTRGIFKYHAKIIFVLLAVVMIHLRSLSWFSAICFPLQSDLCCE